MEIQLPSRVTSCQGLDFLFWNDVCADPKLLPGQPLVVTCRRQDQ